METKTKTCVTLALRVGTMPWAALPFDDKRKDMISRIFEVEGIPTMIMLDQASKTMIHQRCFNAK